MATFPPLQEPKIITAEKWTQLPESMRRTEPSAFSQFHGGKALHSFLEGPVVVDGVLYTTDIAHGRIFATDLASGEWSVAVEYKGGQPNGLAWHPRKREMIIVDRHAGVLALSLETRELRTLLGNLNGQPFLGPNDVIIDADGNIVFTDQGQSGLHNPVGRVYRYNMDTGRVDLLLAGVPSPNGLLFDRDEGVLFVGVTRDNAVWHAPVFPDGTLQRVGRFSSYYGLGGPDGMTLDAEGNLFVCIVRLGTIFVHKPDGTPLARIVMPEGMGDRATNLTWSAREEGAQGEGEGDLLYITESDTATILTVKWHCRGWLGKIYYETK